VLALTDLDPDSPGLALGTRQGVVKRVNPEVVNRDEWEVIALKDGDEVVGGVQLRTGEETLCFITSDAQLLHYSASLVRPQGRGGGGMAGIKLAAGARVVAFGALEDVSSAVVVTVAGSSSALPGTEAGSGKVTPFTEYPSKGRATGGVRCMRFLKGEDELLFAWSGPEPVRAAAASGTPADLPPATGRRDGSGTPLGQPIAACAGPVHGRLSTCPGGWWHSRSRSSSPRPWSAAAAGRRRAARRSRSGWRPPRPRSTSRPRSGSTSRPTRCPPPSPA
jgi:DNA gyrase subunit A